MNSNIIKLKTQLPGIIPMAIIGQLIGYAVMIVTLYASLHNGDIMAIIQTCGVSLFVSYAMRDFWIKDNYID